MSRIGSGDSWTLMVRRPGTGTIPLHIILRGDEVEIRTGTARPISLTVRMLAELVLDLSEAGRGLRAREAAQELVEGWAPPGWTPTALSAEELAQLEEPDDDGEVQP